LLRKEAILMNKRPAIFLDRDGTLIEEVNFLSRVEDLRVFDFTFEALRSLKNSGFALVVTTKPIGYRPWALLER
jgi:D-glycero-D-manno-heptose 1,7-bisphosphate phosphatase